jgi:hypothetical protein
MQKGLILRGNITGETSDLIFKNKWGIDEHTKDT